MIIPPLEKAYTVGVMVANLQPEQSEGALLSLRMEDRIAALEMMPPDDAAQALMSLKESHRLSTLRKMRPEARVGPLEAMEERDRKATLDCFHVDDRVKHRIAKLNAREKALKAAEADQRQRQQDDAMQLVLP